MGSGKLFSGILIGAAAGAILGVLFAPGKGSETRDQLSKKGADLKNDLTGKINDWVDKGSRKLKNLKTEAKEAVANETENFAPPTGEATSSFT